MQHPKVKELHKLLAWSEGMIEASSSLDSNTEYEIMSHMRSLKDSVTIIAITHNSRLIHTEDMVIKL